MKLVILDLNMPGLNGFETLRCIRNSPELSCVPVIIFSSTKARGEIDRTYSLGANACFNKPNSLPVYFEQVRVVVQYWLQFAQLPSPARPRTA